MYPKYNQQLTLSNDKIVQSNACHVQNSHAVSILLVDIGGLAALTEQVTSVLGHLADGVQVVHFGMTLVALLLEHVQNLAETPSAVIGGVLGVTVDVETKDGADYATPNIGSEKLVIERTQVEAGENCIVGAAVIPVSANIAQRKEERSLLSLGQADLVVNHFHDCSVRVAGRRNKSTKNHEALVALHGNRLGDWTVEARAGDAASHIVSDLGSAANHPHSSGNLLGKV